jgi:C-terminal processing protease CtpA/Prc
MYALSRLTLRNTLSVLAAAMMLSAPALAEPWRGGMAGMHHNCPAYHQSMQRDACPYMQPRMKHQAMPMSGQSLGVMVSNLSNAMLDTVGLSHGINVEKVLSDSSAAQAGIRAGDLITEFAGSPVYSADRLRWLVRKAEPGKALEIKLLRDKQPVTLNATLTVPEPKAKCEEKPSSRIGT